MAAPSSAFEIASHLIRFPSVSRASNVEITDWIQHQLERVGFVTERVDYVDSSGVAKANLVACRGASHRSGSLALFAHTDVVPADHWTGPGGDPFEPALEEGRLYGRGACDMKGPLAAMLAAAMRVDPAEQRGTLWIICTADEEVGFVGAKRLVADSRLYPQLVRESPLGIIGEPTRLEIVHAHKGVCGMRIISRGRAGHSSTREGRSANLAMIPMLQELKAIRDETERELRWQDDRFDPPTLSWNIHFADDGSAINVTAARSIATVLFRPMPGVDSGPLVQRVRAAAQRLGLECHLIADGRPLWVEPSRAAVRELMRVAGCTTTKTVCYGTDGGEFTELADLAVIGPGDITQGHTDDEWIALEQLQRGTELYEQAIRHWCGGRSDSTSRE